MLSNFQLGNVALFQSFLVGQPQFRNVLANPQLEQLRQRVIASYHLGPMNRKECGDYLLHRLQKVGWKSDPSFDASAIDAIFVHTGGIPRRINTLCNRLLLLGFLDDLHNFSAPEVNKVWTDLQAENPMQGSTNPDNGPSKPSSSLASDVEIQGRIAGLERRIANQEAFTRRVASALQGYFRFEDSEAR